MDNTTVVTANYGTIITAIGSAKITECILRGTKINITHAAVGDGNGAYYKPTVENSVALLNECWRGEIAYAEISETTPNMIDVKFVVPAEVGGFTIREAALIDADGDTIAICNTPDAQKITITDGVSFPLSMIMHILVTDASVVEFSINPSLDTVSREEMEIEMQKFANSVGSAIIKTITIPADVWTDAGELASGKYIYVADVADTDATEDHFPSMALELPSLEIGSEAGLCPTIQTLDGVIRFWAVEKPSANMVGTIMLRSENLAYNSTPEGGDPTPTPTPPDGESIASDKEVEEMITDIFGK